MDKVLRILKARDREYERERGERNKETERQIGRERKT